MQGSCLCGTIQYEITPPFKGFQYCHCSRCRKFTGSAHSATIFVPANQFKWTKGQKHVKTYDMPDAKYMTTSFCDVCGSSLPWAIKGVPNMAIPAGTLDDVLDINIKPSQNIYWDSKAQWYVHASDLPTHAELPKK